MKIRISSEVEVAPEDVATIAEELRIGSWYGSGSRYTFYIYAACNKVYNGKYTAEAVHSTYIAGVRQPTRWR
jgi:hypothetical protein